MSTLSVDTIQGQTVAGNVKLPAGCVLQCLQTIKTDTFDSSSTSAVDITGLSVTITPKYATSKVLVMFNVHIVGDDSRTGLRLLRGSTTLSIGDASSNIKMTAIGYFSNNTSPSAYNGGLTSHVILDLPATTNATTYKLQGQVLPGFRVNKTRYNTDNGNASRGVSTITVMEIAQ